MGQSGRTCQLVKRNIAAHTVSKTLLEKSHANNLANNASDQE